MLEVRGLTTTYGAVEALKDASFVVGDASITAVLGANGAGKTTLLRTISGLVRPRSGSVRYQNEELVGRSPEDIARLGISHVPEGRGVVQELSVEENLRLGGLWRRDRPQLKQSLDQMYEMFPPLADRRRELAFSLSGGERQMLAMGRALMARPRLLLLDEPSLGLAPIVVSRIMSLLRSLKDDTGLTVLLVEQNARSALSVADQAIVLSLGKVAIAEAAGRLARDDTLRHAYLGF
jgi:branched-chain amino acid transport system ATP-binding protein